MRATKFSFCYIMFLMVPVFFLQSCKDDEDGPGLSFTFDGTTYTVSNAYLENAGEVVTVNSQSPSHFNHTIYLSDIDLEEPDENQQKYFVLVLNLYSPLGQSADLSTGRFDYITVSDISGENEELDDVKFFTLSSLVLINGETGTEREISGGVINISGTGESLSVTYDLDFSLGKNIKGSFNGPFVLVEDD